MVADRFWCVGVAGSSAKLLHTLNRSRFLLIGKIPLSSLTNPGMPYQNLLDK